MIILLACANADRLPLRDGCVQAVMTSPPYYGLRKYQGTGSAEIGLEETPELYLERMVAVFREVRRVLRDDGVCFVNMGDSYVSQAAGNTDATFTEKQASNRGNSLRRERSNIPPGYKPLDLMNIPARLVLALQADGWYHRSTIIWSKPNPMPESVSGTRWERHRVKVGNKGREQARMSGHFQNHSGNNVTSDAEWADCPGCEKCAPNGGLVLRRGSWRPTTSHEYIFMLTKTADYWADGEAVREGYDKPLDRWGGDSKKLTDNLKGEDNPYEAAHRERDMRPNPAGRNQRSVWTFATQPYPGSHFATYPEELPRRCLKAAISERGCCPKCGAQWARVVDNPRIPNELRNRADETKMSYDPLQVGGGQKLQNWRDANPSHTLGWLPTCTCPPHEPVPAIVLDPFCGTGTTGLVARELGAHFIGVDLSFAYLHDQARSRLGLEALDAWSQGKAKQDGRVITDLPLFERRE